jgi:hypothetical protein
MHLYLLYKSMKKILYISVIFFFGIIIFACKSESKSDTRLIPIAINQSSSQHIKLDPNGQSIESRFMTPNGFVRTVIQADSFGTFLRQIPLKNYGEPVLYYNGLAKPNKGVYVSVMDLPIGSQDLHQCADAVMNLWGLYLFSQNRLNEIQFRFLGDNSWHNYAKWLGNRNSTSVLFFSYMQQVFGAANTRSLFGQLHSITPEEVKIGDVLIVTGKPYGHAITIVDECINTQTGKKLFMLAQSYMPAQETQILINPNSRDLSPWYDFETVNGKIITPEWEFSVNDLRRF